MTDTTHRTADQWAGTPVDRSTAEDPRGAAHAATRAVRLVMRNPILPLLVVTLPVFAIFVPDYATQQNFTNLLLASSVLLLLATGGALVVITGNFDLSMEGTLAFTAVSSAWLMVKGPVGIGWQLSPVLVIPIAVGIGVVIGLINGLLVQGLGVNPFIVTLGMLLTLKGAAAIPTHAQTVYGLPGGYSWVGLHDIHGVSWIVVIAFAIFFVAAVWLRTSTAGRHIYAVGGNMLAARENGVSPLRVVLLVYAISGGLAGVAGWLNAARLDSASASLSDGITFTVFAAIVIGGVSLSGGAGSLWGTLGGAILLGSIDNVLNLIALNPLYVNFVRGGVIIVAVLLIVMRQRLAARLRLQEPAA